jgi:hypothetical protein
MVFFGGNKEDAMVKPWHDEFVGQDLAQDVLPLRTLTPAKAGVQLWAKGSWMPASAGMTGCWGRDLIRESS